MLTEFENLKAAQENLMLDGDGDGDGPDISAHVEVEIEAGAAAAEEEAIVEDGAEVDAEIAADDATMAGYSRLMRAESVIAKFGYTQPIAEMVDPEQVLPKRHTDMPALEALGTVGSPDDQAAQIALEAIKGHLASFWESIKKFCAMIKAKIMGLFDRIAAMFKVKAQKCAALANQVKAAKVDAEKLKSRKAKVPSPADWKTAAAAIISGGHALEKEVAKISGGTVEGKLEVARIPFNVKLEAPKEATALSWDAASVAGNFAQVKALCDMGNGNLVKAAKAAKAAADRLNAYAVKNASAEEAADAKASAGIASGALKALIQDCKTFTSVANKAVSYWMTAAQHVLAASGKGEPAAKPAE